MVVAALAVSYGRVDSAPPEQSASPVVESVEPAPGALVPRQSTIEVDLAVGYGAELWVLTNPSSGTWQRIPESELSFVEGTGVYTWSTGEGRIIEEWGPGEHTIRIVWDTLTGLPDVGTYEWSFRTY